MTDDLAGTATRQLNQSQKVTDALHLRHTLIATALVAALPVSFATSAAQGKPNAGKANAGSKQSNSKKRCTTGREYIVVGTVVEYGSQIWQTAGKKTKKRSDDRYSGTIVIDIEYANKLAMRDDLASYVLIDAPLRGLSGGDLPQEGTEVRLDGVKVPTSCIAPYRPIYDDGDDEEADEGYGEDYGHSAARLSDDAPWWEDDEDEDEDEEEYEEPTLVDDIFVKKVRFEE